jgi:hypothetical protein
VLSRLRSLSSFAPWARSTHPKGMSLPGEQCWKLLLSEAHPAKRARIVLISPRGPLYRHRTGIWKKSLQYAPLTLTTLASLVPDDLNAEILSSTRESPKSTRISKPASSALAPSPVPRHAPVSWQSTSEGGGCRSC